MKSLYIIFIWGSFILASLVGQVEAGTNNDTRYRPMPSPAGRHRGLSTQDTLYDSNTTSTNNDPFGANQEEEPFGGGGETTENPWAKYRWEVTNTIIHWTGGLSLLGSAWIVADILRDRNKRQNSSYHRIMLGLSLFDFASSVFFFLGTWVRPNLGRESMFETPETPAACVASGFFIYLGSVSIPLYNAALSTYFYLMVQRGWREIRISKQFERYVHPFIISFGFIVALVAIPLDLYNPYYNYCYANYSGEGRGTVLSSDIYLSIYWVVVFVSSILVTSLMISIYIHVKRVQARSKHFLFSETTTRIISASTVPSSKSPQGLQRSTSTQNFFSSAIPNSEVQPRNLQRSNSAPDLQPMGGSSRSRRRQEKQERRRLERMQRSDKKTRQVRTMALLYTIPFYATWVVPALWFVFTTVFFRATVLPSTYEIPPRVSFAMNVYVATALPLQGFFNWFIYMLPRFLKLRGRQTSWSLRLAVAKVLGSMSPQPDTRKKKSNHSDKLNGGDERSMTLEIVFAKEEEGERQGNETSGSIDLYSMASSNSSAGPIFDV